MCVVLIVCLFLHTTQIFIVSLSYVDVNVVYVS